MTEERDERKTNSKLERWLSENFPENADDRDINLIMAGIAKKAVYESFRILFEEEESLIAFYAITFDTIKKFLEDKRNKGDEEYNEYAINMCGRFEIGFTDSDNTENEKIGSFTPYMYHIEDSMFKQFETEDDAMTQERCCQWNAENITQQPKAIKDISTKALKMLDDVASLKFQSPEVIIGPFCVIHSCIIEYLKEIFVNQYKVDDMDTYELSVNVMASYDAILHMKEDGTPSVGLKPSVSTKQEIKDDDKATSGNE